MGDRKVSIKIASIPVLSRTLMRKRLPGTLEQGVDLGQLLGEILEWADRLVSSESGSILLDDPILKRGGKPGRLYFAACFGRNSASLAGTYMADNLGIAGETYTTGKPYICRDAQSDKKFLVAIDQKLQLETRTIICCPIVISGAIIGVIELVNRRGGDSYTNQELALLEIFAGYTATLMENALDAREFEELSKRDHLTGLFNDRYFFMRLEHEVERAYEENSDTALIFFDLDHFKEVNDTHGHIAGSRVLAEIGGVVRKIFKKTTAAMARYGGDEYAIILPGTSGEEAERYAETLRAAIEKHVFLRQRAHKGEPALRIKGLITASVGVASQSINVVPADSVRDMAESLLRSADDAMYRAKSQGKNRVVVAGQAS